MVLNIQINGLPCGLSIHPFSAKPEISALLLASTWNITANFRLFLLFHKQKNIRQLSLISFPLSNRCKEEIKIADPYPFDFTTMSDGKCENCGFVKKD